MEQRAVIYRSRILHGLAIIILDGSYTILYKYAKFKKGYKDKDSAYEKINYLESLYLNEKYEDLNKELANEKLVIIHKGR